MQTEAPTQIGVKWKPARVEPEKAQSVQVVEDGLRRAWRRLVPADRGVLLAVSGGPDSMTLLTASARIAGRIGLQLEALTVDHQLRPESAAEVALVAAAAKSLGVTHHVRVAPISGPGIEAAARDARYAALEAVRSERGLSVIATAHSANDQAETLLMRLARGSALGGASSIHEARADRVIRPLLFLTRAQIEAYVAALNLTVARDAMNDDPKFLRTRVRKEVLPALIAAAGPGSERALARFASLAAEDDAELTRQALAALGGMPASFPLELAALARPIARRALATWLVAQGVELNAELIDDCLRAAREKSVATLPGDRLFACKDGRGNVIAAPPRLHATS